MWMQKGVDALKLKDFATAADGFAKSYAIDTTAGRTALLLGQALGAQGKTEEAIEAFQHAAWNGEEAEAKEQMSNIYVRQANAALKGQKFADAVKAADKANSYPENATAYLIAGQSSQKLSKNADAIKYFEKYLEMKPDAKERSGHHLHRSRLSTRARRTTPRLLSSTRRFRTILSSATRPSR